ncbi:phospholipase A2 inhibitor and Ly6/PLAUR domain-containing protein-like [Megalobrama amblycephala]|uniref:phospholipase A2 inhibitor and Ly6/PLAUR domain-containing protein-like n=1 Tax=Megalobrama amblycephala TaxID=75352 RepID=UPI002013CA8E|nr:phospholipase A2 inhibitor and Ly6/PLAUR domain-containing protein-like [Megalobrama amblycephala]
MDLQISVFLLFILCTAGHSLSCYECKGLNGSCADQKVQTCHSGYSRCMSSTGVTKFGDTNIKVKTKDCAFACQSGSMNLGYIKTTTSCCDTDECNLQDAADPSNIPNGRTCYYCDIQSCSNKLICTGDEDLCVQITSTIGGQSTVLKGCASKSLCDGIEYDLGVASISCCEGNLCNSAQRVDQKSEL